MKQKQQFCWKLFQQLQLQQSPLQASLQSSSSSSCCCCYRMYHHVGVVSTRITSTSIIPFIRYSFSSTTTTNKKRRYRQSVHTNYAQQQQQQQYYSYNNNHFRYSTTSSTSTNDSVIITTTNSFDSLNRNSSTITTQTARRIPNDGLSLHDFIVGNNASTDNNNIHIDDIESSSIPNTDEKQRIYTFSIKTYGCQMNVNDTEIVRSVLLSTKQFQEVSSVSLSPADKDIGTEEPDIYLTNTCAIRDGAEQKVITRLQQLRAKNRQKRKHESHAIIGVLGCMAERLKDQLLKDDMADVVVGPDAYRTLPQLLLPLLKQQSERNSNTYNKKDKQYAINVELSTDETYADIIPMRQQMDTNMDIDNNVSSNNSITTFVSIQRGCSNRCSFCIVPFTRGIERSRPYDSIISEVERLHYEDNIKEITLLGQNVNSIMIKVHYRQRHPQV